MKIASGVDLIEIDRVGMVLARHGQRYVERVLTPAEREICGKRVESLAARFAAKEAVSKALGCGLGEVSLQDIEILQDELGAPVLQLHRAALEKAQSLGLVHWSISLSHSATHAIAMAVAISD